MGYDGQLISEHGVKRYMKGVNASRFANINPMQRSGALQQQWDECNFGCHGPSYRVQRRVVGVDDMIQQINKVSPLIAGGLDLMEAHYRDVRRVFGEWIASQARALHGQRG